MNRFSCALVLICAFLVGCSGSGVSTIGGGLKNFGAAYAGKSYQSGSFAVGASSNAVLVMNVDSSGAINSTITISAASALSKKAVSLDSSVIRPQAASGVYSGSGNFTGDSGAFSTLFAGLSGTVSGNAPTPPDTTGGNFTLTINGVSYGPFAFKAPTTVPGAYAITIIGLPANADYSQANAINDSGLVVGGASTNNGLDAFKWDAKGGLVDLGTFGGQYASAQFVNNSGTIEGQFTPATSDLYHAHAFVYSGNGFQDLAIPAGYTASEPAGIDNAGNAYAAASVPNNSGTVPSTAFVGGTASGEIGPNPSSQKNQIMGVSQNGIVYGNVYDTKKITVFWNLGGKAVSATDFAAIGYSATIPAFSTGPNGEVLSRISANNHAAVFDIQRDASIDLGLVGFCTGYNAAGTAVGNATDAVGNSYGFVWTQSTGARNLNSLIDPASGATIFAARGINASGQIICQVSSKTIRSSALGIAAVLTPVKAP